VNLSGRPRPRARVLIVDDDPAVLDALEEMIELRLPNVRVTACDSGIDALAAAATREYDAIVADVRMPGIDGLELLTRMRPHQPDTPVILITGHGEQDLATLALERGAYDFLQKPIERASLVEALRRGIDEHRRRRF
jgi:DNA-binding NtrC family response regulator